MIFFRSLIDWQLFYDVEREKARLLPRVLIGIFGSLLVRSVAMLSGDDDRCLRFSRSFVPRSDFSVPVSDLFPFLSESRRVLSCKRTFLLSEADLSKVA